MTLSLRALLILLLALLLLTGAAFLRARQVAEPAPFSAITPGSPDPAALIAPVLGDVQVALNDVSAAWDLTFTRSQAELLAALSHRYPGLPQRFPGGVDLSLVDEPGAPEPLRGAYDAQPAILRFGAFWPHPQAGQVVQPVAEAWADCRRDLELGPARSLHCYLYVRGDPGPTLDGLAVLAWVQALDYVFSGRQVQLDPTTLPATLLTAARDADQWTYADACLSLSP